MIIVKILYADDHEDLACEIAEMAESLDKNEDDVAVIAKYEDAKELITELIYFGYDLGSIDIEREDIGEYWDEYIITISCSEIWCEKFKRENGYFCNDATVTYIMGNCSSKVVSHCNSDIMYEVCICNDDEEDLDAEITVSEMTAGKNERPAATTSKSTYMVNGHEVSNGEYEAELKKANEKFLVDMDGILRKYCNTLELVNTFLPW